MARACEAARREPSDVTLIAVSKTHPAVAIVPLIEAGQREFGENRVQEAPAKWPALRARYPPLELPLNAQSQQNKAGAENVRRTASERGGRIVGLQVCAR